VHSSWDFRPALCTETVFETATGLGLAWQQDLNKVEFPRTLLRAGLIMHDYEDEACFCPATASSKG